MLHSGEPTEVENDGTPSRVFEQRARLKELIAETGQAAELRDDPVPSEMGHRNNRGRERRFVGDGDGDGDGNLLTSPLEPAPAAPAPLR